MRRQQSILWALMFLAMAASTVGCSEKTVSAKTPPALLPAKIRLHPFTGTRQFSDGGGVTGIEARVEVIDHFDDPTKAFGTYRFEAYQYRPVRSENRGKRLAVWASDLTDAKSNVQHWDGISRTYRFRLKWDKPIPVGRQFVLRVIFSPPTGERLFDERTFISGE